MIKKYSQYYKNLKYHLSSSSWHVSSLRNNKIERPLRRIACIEDCYYYYEGKTFSTDCIKSDFSSNIDE